MVTKVVIRDNKNSPIHYISDLENFKNGKVYEFKPGVNVIVGENGCGKTTLMNLIKNYLVVDYNECFRGDYNCNINALFRTFFKDDGMLNGVDVYADYTKNTFRLSHAGEKERNKAVKTAADFGALFDQNSSSTGEGVVVALNSLFGYIFGKDAKLAFDYGQFKDNYPQYTEYVEPHRIRRRIAMAKSFCSGCKHWVFIQSSETFENKGFHFCDIFDRYELKLRKLWCNGKLKE